MSLIVILIALHFIAAVAYLLYKGYNPQATLLFSGLAMLLLAPYITESEIAFTTATNYHFTNLFALIKDTFLQKLASVGLMIMAVGGFVTYMQKSGANSALIYVSIQPLSILSNYPYFAAIMVIPIGQLLYLCIPSATGLVLLLVASILPILLGLGVSRLSAVSIITACTVFDMGPGSTNTSKASELIDQNNISYFLDMQLPYIIPLTVIMMVLFFFHNRHLDRKSGHIPIPTSQSEIKVTVPIMFAILPLLPLILLIFFSSIFNFITPPIKIDITTAIFITLLISVAANWVWTKKLKESLDAIKYFWEGMGSLFVKVVILLVAAEIFATGLISMGFISELSNLGNTLGATPNMLKMIMIIIVFSGSVLTGSANSIFHAIAPQAYNHLTQFGVNSTSAILPLQMASSIGRGMSPISGVINASSQLAGVTPFDLAKRNALPLTIILIIMLIMGFFS
ncbi:MAG: C4-dicarboxylate transporter DcuC [Breznakibacter sp.]|nr:C4-dicarboxylate transporter DcuC [Breznakibacter sp.]